MNHLVFGVSMPFRTSVITKDNINSMMYHQMAGRAGRRGLDKEGNVVFINNSWENIKRLSISSIPNIKGQDTAYGINIAGRVSNNPDIWENIKHNSLNENQENSIYNNNIFTSMNLFTEDKENHMMWKIIYP